MAAIVEYLILEIALAYLFYRSYWPIIIGLPGFALFYLWKREYGQRKVKHLLRQEFQTFVETVGAAVEVGYSIEHAFAKGEEELQTTYEKGSILINEIHQINETARYHESIEKAMLKFAYQSEVDEIISFAEIFAYANRRGASMGDILKRSSRQITDRIDVLEKLETITAGVQLELHIMMVMPMGILGYLTLTNSEYLEVIYHGLECRLLMTMSLLIYGLACYLGIRAVNKIAQGVR